MHAIVEAEIHSVFSFAESEIRIRELIWKGIKAPVWTTISFRELLRPMLLKLSDALASATESNEITSLVVMTRKLDVRRMDNERASPAGFEQVIAESDIQ